MSNLSKAMMYAMLVGMGAGMNNYGLKMAEENDELRNVDIDKEYELIKQKKSNLSVRLRNEVEYRWREKQEVTHA